MKSVTSLSGGRSSSMMALQHPTDINIFAVVLTDHKKSAPRDKGLLRECQNRIPNFIASLEADQTLANMLRLEQELGQAIEWVAAEYPLDRYIQGTTDLPGYRAGKPMLPNARTRFCTVEAKLKPIFWHLYLHHWDGDPFLMNIGFRWDEPARVESWNCDKEKFKFPTGCRLKPDQPWIYSNLEWRISRFPLFEDRISKHDVDRFWEKKGWIFPEVSNCRFCFHHRDLEQQRQAQIEPDNLKWWLGWEATTGKTFGVRPLIDILNQPLLDVFEPTSCHCTD